MIKMIKSNNTASPSNFPEVEIIRNPSPEIFVMSARLMLPPRDRDRKRKKKVTTEEKIKPERNKSNLLGKKVPPKSRQRSARRVSSAGEKSPGFNKEKLEIEKKKRKRKKEQARHLGDDTPCNFGFDLISITVWFVFSRRSPTLPFP